MNKPKNQIQEVLYHLIKYGSVSYLDFPYLQGFRTRISELRRKLKMSTKKVVMKSKYGNSYVMHVHYLEDTEKAKEIYNEMFNENLKTKQKK